MRYKPKAKEYDSCYYYIHTSTLDGEVTAEQLEQIRHHLRIKAMLEVWLFIHIPATIALLAALFAHFGAESDWGP